MICFGTADDVRRGHLVKVSGAFGWLSNVAKLQLALMKVEADQQCRDMLNHVLVCALPVNRSFVTVMKNMSDAKSVTFEMIRDKWSLFMDQIVVGFLLPLADRGVVYADLRPGPDP